MKKQTPNITARMVLQNQVAHIASLTQSSHVTSFLTKARLKNPDAHLARTLATLIDIGAFLAITFPPLVHEKFRSLDRAQALQYFEEAMPRLDDWTLSIYISRLLKNCDRVTHASKLNYQEFTSEACLLIAFAHSHHYSIAEILLDAAQLGVLRVEAGDCRMLYGALEQRIKLLDLDELFF